MSFASKYPGPARNSGKVYFYQITLGELNQAWQKGDLIPYANSRGTIGTNRTRAKKIADNFHPGSFGTITISHAADGTIQLIDANHRVAGLSMLFESERLTPTLSAYMVGIEMIDPARALQTYQDRNNNRNVTSAENITNLDFIAGKLTADMMGENTLGARQRHSMFDVALALDEKGYGNVEIEDVFRARNLSRELMTTAITANDFNLSRVTKNRMIEVVSWFKAIETSVAAGATLEDRPAAKECLRTPGLMMGLMIDYVGAHEIALRTVPWIVRSILIKAPKLRRYAKTIARRNSRELDYDKFVELLSSKSL